MVYFSVIAAKKSALNLLKGFNYVELIQEGTEKPAKIHRQRVTSVKIFNHLF